MYVLIPSDQYINSEPLSTNEAAFMVYIKLFKAHVSCKFEGDKRIRCNKSNLDFVATTFYQAIVQ